MTRCDEEDRYDDERSRRGTVRKRDMTMHDDDLDDGV